MLPLVQHNYYYQFVLVEDKYSGVEELSAQVKACQFEREKREKEDRNDISYSTVTAVWCVLLALLPLTSTLLLPYNTSSTNSDV